MALGWGVWDGHALLARAVAQAETNTAHRSPQRACALETHPMPGGSAVEPDVRVVPVVSQALYLCGLARPLAKGSYHALRILHKQVQSVRVRAKYEGIPGPWFLLDVYDLYGGISGDLVQSGAVLYDPIGELGLLAAWGRWGRPRVRIRRRW